MSSEPATREHGRHRWILVTALAVAAIAIAFYVGSFFIGHYLRSPTH